VLGHDVELAVVQSFEERAAVETLLAVDRAGVSGAILDDVRDSICGALGSTLRKASVAVSRDLSLSGQKAC
jgi:hypothetical protein